MSIFGSKKNSSNSSTNTTTTTTNTTTIGEMGLTGSAAVQVTDILAGAAVATSQQNSNVAIVGIDSASDLASRALDLANNARAVELGGFSDLQAQVLNTAAQMNRDYLTASLNLAGRELNATTVAPAVSQPPVVMALGGSGALGTAGGEAGKAAAASAGGGGTFKEIIILVAAGVATAIVLKAINKR